MVRCARAKLSSPCHPYCKLSTYCVIWMSTPLALRPVESKRLSSRVHSTMGQKHHQHRDMSVECACLLACMLLLVNSKAAPSAMGKATSNMLECSQQAYGYTRRPQQSPPPPPHLLPQSLPPRGPRTKQAPRARGPKGGERNRRSTGAWGVAWLPPLLSPAGSCWLVALMSCRQLGRTSQASQQMLKLTLATR